MSEQRKRLKKLSIAILVLSLFFLILGIFLFALGIIEAIDFNSELNELDASNPFIFKIMLGSGFILDSFLLLLLGGFGKRASNHPRRTMSLIIVSTIVALLCLFDLFGCFSSGFPFVVSLFYLFVLIVSAAFLVLAQDLRKCRADLEQDEIAGPDGEEFKDGYNPKKLGFMRVIQVLCAINILVTMMWLTTLIKGNYELSFSNFVDLLNLIFDAVLFWFIWQRSSATRFYAIGFSLFNIFIGSSFNMMSGDFSFGNQMMLSFFDLINLCYFLTSRRAVAILNVPFSFERVRASAQSEEKNFFNLRKWSFWRDAIIYFCVFCVVGHWMEAGFCTLIKWGIVPGIYDPTSQIWSDWLYPFPVYGFGTMACILVLFPIKNVLQKSIKRKWTPLVISFLINTLICTAIELVLGLLQNQPVNGVYPLWDYSNMFCNFMGQVCLQNSLAFGGVSTLMTWVVYPSLEGQMSKLNNQIANILFIVILVFFLILTCLYIVQL